jgi:hypothetical protein
MQFEVMTMPRSDEDIFNDGLEARTPDVTCQSIDWYAEGQSRTVEVGTVQVTIRYVGGKGCRARIAIVAPAGAVFLTLPFE